MIRKYARVGDGSTYSICLCVNIEMKCNSLPDKQLKVRLTFLSDGLYLCNFCFRDHSTVYYFFLRGVLDRIFHFFNMRTRDSDPVIFYHLDPVFI